MEGNLKTITDINWINSNDCFIANGIIVNKNNASINLKFIDKDEATKLFNSKKTIYYYSPGIDLNFHNNDNSNKGGEENI